MTTTQHPTATTYDQQPTCPYLFDTGAVSSFISSSSASQLHGSYRQTPDHTIILANGSTTTASTEFTTTIQLSNHECTWTFTVLPFQCALTFGCDFLRTHQATFRYSDQTVELILPQQTTIRLPILQQPSPWDHKQNRND